MDAGAGWYREEVLRRVAAELIRNPGTSCRSLAEVAWGPGVPPWRVKEVLRRLRAGVVPAGVDRDLLAAAFARRRVFLRWDRDSALEALRVLAAKLGRIPRMQDTRGASGVPAAGVYCRLYGSWNPALRAAGLPVNRASPALVWRHRGDPREDAVAALRAAAELTGGVPSISAYEGLRHSLGRADWPSVCSLRIIFGSWSRALEAAGLDGGPRVRVVRPREVTAVVSAEPLVSRVAARGFAVPSDFAGVSPGVVL